ncbi:MAG: hypothetical protein ABW076_01170 [Candidatus Thiodiazotropha sp.]
MQQAFQSMEGRQLCIFYRYEPITYKFSHQTEQTRQWIIHAGLLTHEPLTAKDSAEAIHNVFSRPAADA